MNKLVKALLLGAGVAAVIGGVYLYEQLNKLTNYCISVKKVRLNKFATTSADIDLSLNFVNSSKLLITLYSQEYIVYLNDAFVSKVSNAVKQDIKPESASILNVKLQFNPKDAVKIASANIVDLLTKPDNVSIKISSSLNVGVGPGKFKIKYDYVTTLKELTTSSDPNPSAPKC